MKSKLKRLIQHSFSRRVAAYFGALFLLAIAILFWFWFFGFATLGIVGAKSQHITEAMHFLGIKADAQRSFIAKGVKDRRGDILVISENRTISKQLERRDVAVQKELDRIFNRLQRAYPDRYQHLLIVDPANSQILASDVAADNGETFDDHALIKRATQPGATEIIELLNKKNGANTLAIIRQIHALNPDGYAIEKLVGILIAYVDLQQFITEELLEDVASESTLLFNPAGKILARFPIEKKTEENFKFNNKFTSGFQGTLLEINSVGEEFIVVYRHIPLSGSKALTLVHYASKDFMLGDLKGRANFLILVGLIVTCIALILITVAAGRLTRPILLLSQKARQIGAGDLSIRAAVSEGDSHEIISLSTAFNSMAEDIEKAHQTLEDKIEERTKELQRSETRHRILFESTPDALLVIGRAGLIDCNLAAINIFGARSRDALIKESLLALSPLLQTDGQESRLVAQRTIEEIKDKGTVNFEWLHQRLDTGKSFVADVLLNRFLIDGRTFVQCTIRDISARKLAEENLRLSEENLSITLQSIGDAVIATDASGFVTRMNGTAERLTGWTLAEAAGRPLPEVFHIINSQTRIPSINPVQLVMHHGEIVGLANHTALLSRDGCEYQISDSAAPIRNPSGNIMGVVLVFSDVTEDYRIREVLASTAELLAHTGEIAKVGGWELDLRTMKFNWTLQTFLIHEMAPALPPTLEQSIALFVPEHRPIMKKAVQEAIDFGTPYDIELRKFTITGRMIWVRVQGYAVIENGKVIKLFGAVHDISDRKQAEQYEQFRSGILEMLAGVETLPVILKNLVLGVEQLYPDMLCSILLLDDEGKHLVKGIAPSLPDFYNAAIDGVAIGPDTGSCGTAAYTGERVVVEDISTYPYWAHYKELAASANLAACWSQPIRSSTGKVLGTFAIYHRQTNKPNTNDINIIEQCARLASIAIERNLASEKLHDSEEHYRLLTEDASDVVWKMDKDSRFTYISPADEHMRGYSAEQVIGQHIFELLTEEGIANLKKKAIERHKAEQQGEQTGTMNFELQQHCVDGTLIWTEVRSTPTRDALGNINGYQGITRDITHRRLADEALRIAAIAFESQEGMYITNTDWLFLRVNKAFSYITGYSANEIVGHKPDILRSGMHDAAFFTEMTAELESSESWQGEVWDKRKNGEVYPILLTVTVVKDEAGLSSHYVGTFTDISSRKSAEEKIKNLAFYDPLTCLPNRRLLMDRLEQALAGGVRHQRKSALLFVDLDNFKTLNDTLGHDKGDILLQQVAKRLITCTRDGDTVARLGGDEFVIMLEDLSEDTIDAATQAEAVGEQILAALNEGYQLAGIEHRSTPSIGITLFGEHAETIDEPLKRADLAMYQAKAAGRNTLRFFDPQMQAVVAAHVAMEEGLREAIAKDQFLIYYQVQVKGEGQLTGAEALIRWKHPERGMVSPAEFISLAEETGLILPLGRWVLNTSCVQLALWANDPQMAHLTLAVNVSPRQFHQANFVEQVLDILKSTGANPQRLKLELTEGLLVSNVEDVIAKMHALKQQGVGFSLDDFGTGFSSLSYLKRLPLDQLKIDQGFVRDILVDSNDAAIARMVIVLAESLGLSVIAEGVETLAHRDYLASQGCHAYQGYLFSRPLPLLDFEAFVKRG